VHRPFEVSDLHLLAAVTDVAVLPDGRAVYELGWPDPETDRNRSQLWLREPGGARLLTVAHRASRPRPSPDGRHLALLVAAGPTDVAQLGLLPLGGGELRILTDRPDGVTDLAWFPDGAALVIEAPTRPVDQDGVDDDELARRPRVITRLGARANGRGWVHDRRRQLHRVAVGDGSGLGESRQLTSLDGDATAPAVSGDGRVAFAGSDGPDADLTGAVDLWCLDLAGDGRPVRLTDGAGLWADATWLADGRLLGRGATEVGVRFWRPHMLDPAGGPPRPVGHDDVNTVVPGSTLRPLVVDGAVIVPAIRRGAVHLDRLEPDGGTWWTVVGGDVAVSCASMAADGGGLVVGMATPEHPAALCSVLDGDVAVLSDHHRPLIDAVEVAPVAPLDGVTSADGSPVPGWVITPPAGAPGPGPDGRRPGLVLVHGGPMGQYGRAFFDEFQVAASLGHVVVAGNPRGSDGYGEPWARGLVGDLGGPDWDDVRALTEALAARPDVDPDRIGIAGGSYGGFMAAWAIGHSDRYAAAVVERAVTNWETLCTTSDIGGWFVEPHLGADVHTDVDALRRRSPVNHTGTVTTPTLILHSEEDWRCPIEQAEQLFGLLRRRGTEVTLVRFPGEDHELSRTGLPSHRVERFTQLHDFLARHLGGRPITVDHSP
jgi:dipeptidyl aminopeptidase/acylaminoacyl peptidase